MKHFLIIAALMTLAGCSDSYRYPCQDPNNWELKQCKKPFCSANGTCPEDLRHYEKKNAPEQSTPTKGACK